MLIRNAKRHRQVLTFMVMNPRGVLRNAPAGSLLCEEFDYRMTSE